jgi:hypothetical protein
VVGLVAFGIDGWSARQERQTNIQVFMKRLQFMRETIVKPTTSTDPDSLMSSLRAEFYNATEDFQFGDPADYAAVHPEIEAIQEALSSQNYSLIANARTVRTLQAALTTRLSWWRVLMRLAPWLYLSPLVAFIYWLILYKQQTRRF